MSNTGVRIFGCPTCGFRVDTNESSCPRCGNEFKDDTKFECPFCGDLVKSGLDECPSCHISYSEFKSRAAPKATEDSIDSLLMEIIKLESTSVKEEEKRFSCPKCDLLLEGTETECPRCGKDLDVEVALQCPVCGSLVGMNDVRCRECGTVFDEDAASADRAEEGESRPSEIMPLASAPMPVRREARTPPRGGPITAKDEDRQDLGSAILGKLKDTVRFEPEKKSASPPPPAPAPPPSEPEPLTEEPEPEPVAEPPPSPLPEATKEAALPSFEEFEKELDELETESPVPAPKKAPSGGKKKTRKLKAKPRQ